MNNAKKSKLISANSGGGDNSEKSEKSDADSTKLSDNNNNNNNIDDIWIDRVDQRGKTALDYASFMGHVACVQALLSNGASTRIGDKFSQISPPLPLSSQISSQISL